MWPSHQEASVENTHKATGPVSRVQPACYLWKATLGMGTIADAWSEGNRDMQIVNFLSPADTATVSCGFGLNVPAATIQELDLAVIVYFRPWPLTFIRQRRVF